LLFLDAIATTAKAKNSSSGYRPPSRYSHVLYPQILLQTPKKLPGFEYDPAKGSFKGWLLTMTRWRITAQLRRRRPGCGQLWAQRPCPASTARTATIERLPDPAGSALEALWDEEWEKNLLAAAIERVKKKVAPREYQVFDF